MTSLSRARKLLQFQKNYFVAFVFEVLTMHPPCAILASTTE